MDNHHILYTKEAIEERLSFHKRRLNELQEANYNQVLQEIHAYQISRFEQLLQITNEKGLAYIDQVTR